MKLSSRNLLLALAAKAIMVHGRLHEPDLDMAMKDQVERYVSEEKPGQYGSQRNLTIHGIEGCLVDSDCSGGHCVGLECNYGKEGDRCESHNDCLGACLMDWDFSLGGGLRCHGDGTGTVDHHISDCMAGSTMVTKFRGDDTEMVMVRDLKVGDEIKGIDEEKNDAVCNVVSIFKSGKGKFYGNYTADHYIYDSESDMIVTHGKGGEPGHDDSINHNSKGAGSKNKKLEGGSKNKKLEKTTDDMYDVFTDCPLGVDESGVSFTGISKNLCKGEMGDLSWTEYLSLHAGLLRLIFATGIHDYSAFRSLDKARQHLGGVCKAMIKCIRRAGDELESEEERCRALEQKSQIFYDQVLTEETQKRIAEKIKAKNKGRNKFPGIGEGAITNVVARGIF